MNLVVSIADVSCFDDTLSGFNEWLGEWLDDFLIEDYDGLSLTVLPLLGHYQTITLKIPVDQIKSKSFGRVKANGFRRNCFERKYPDTTNSNRFKLFKLEIDEDD